MEQKPAETLVQKIYVKSCEILEDSAEYLATWPVGQTLLKHTDKCLWTLEKCAEWSIPNSTKTTTSSETNGTFGKPAPLVRPLPWLVFLPLLLCMRVFRVCINIGATFAGVETVKAADIVRFVQLRRRRVRALKFLGLRQIRYRKMCKENEHNCSWNQRIYNKVMGALCFKQNYNEISEKITIKDLPDEPKEDGAGKASGSDLKRKYIEIFKSDELEWENLEDDEEIMKKIDKLAEDNDPEEDLDFVPDEEDSEFEEDSMSESEDETSSVSKAKVLHRPNSHNSLTNEIIEEENEDSDSTTVSANSDDESTQHTIDTDKNSPNKDLLVSNNNKTDQMLHHVDSALTSDEYYSPQNSMSVTPEPSCDLSKNHAQTPIDSSKKLDNKQETENLINSEKNQVTPSSNNVHNNNLITDHEVRTHSAHSQRGYGKKHKNRRRLLRRKRK